MARAPSIILSPSGRYWGCVRKGIINVGLVEDGRREAPHEYPPREGHLIGTVAGRYRLTVETCGHVTIYTVALASDRTVLKETSSAMLALRFFMERI